MLAAFKLGEGPCIYLIWPEVAVANSVKVWGANRVAQHHQSSPYRCMPLFQVSLRRYRIVVYPRYSESVKMSGQNHLPAERSPEVSSDSSLTACPAPLLV